MDLSAYDRVRALRWTGDALELLDQRKLPHETIWHRYDTARAVAGAIHDLVVRGAPAIGIAAAYGVVLAAREAQARGKAVGAEAMAEDLAALRASRPTAVNLFWALDRMQRVLAAKPTIEALDAEARAIEREDYAANLRMAELGAALIAPGSGVLTHCNTGSLATAGLGTALGVIRAAYAQGKLARVFNTETRPWMQGARLTSWELLEDGIPARLIVDGAGAHFLSQGLIDWVIVGADRICANGDTANKIGTATLAIAARHYGKRVMVVAPSTTVDMATASGDRIAIELRNAAEITESQGRRVAAPGVDALNPVFDVTPAAVIDVIVTEKGVIERPDLARMRAVFGG